MGLAMDSRTALNRLLPGSTGHLFILALIHALHGQRAYGAVHFEGACPEGYTSVDGQIPGGDKFGRGFNNRVNSMTVCEQDCSDREDCRSFHFSPSSTQCFLNDRRTPHRNETYKDYVLCAKDGTEDPPPDVEVEEEEEEEEEPDEDAEAREAMKGQFTESEHMETWETAQKWAHERLELVKQRYVITRDLEMTEDEKYVLLDELEKQIQEHDDNHEEHLYRYRLMSPAPPPPPPKPRKKVHNPDYVADEDDEDYLMTGRYWGGRYGRKKRARHSRFRDTDPHVRKSEGKGTNSPIFMKELDTVVKEIESMRARTEAAGFTEREKQKINDDIDRYMDDELDRFEEIIEAEEDELNVPWEYEDYKGRIVKVSKEERKREMEDAKRRKKRAKDKAKQLKNKQMELGRKIRSREISDAAREETLKKKEKKEKKQAEREAKRREKEGIVEEQKAEAETQEEEEEEEDEDEDEEEEEEEPEL
mmetsp:Transcript_14752/g.33526  ORF Transcript_14752/g.33526 Transcript_14752/m.33526 type:complete len:477 (+) Transcript_14752:95-1525(+)